MGSDWRYVTVGDVASKITKGTTPTTIGGCFVDCGINFVKVESITDDGRIDSNKLAHIDKITETLLTRSILEEDDVLFTIAGTIGRVALVPESLLPANTNQAVAIVRPDKNKVLPRFLYYALCDKQRISQAHTKIVQSVQANFSLGELNALDIPLPGKAEQRAIAYILGTLDDKIELNRRMNETLESISKAIFKSWFIDFDPVRAKAEGRGPGLPKHIADLFPKSFENSAIGEVPSSWQVKGLDEIATFLNGLALQKYPPTNGETLPVIKIAQLRAGNSTGADQASLDVPHEYVIEDGDVLFSWSGSLEVKIWCGGKGALNQHLFKVTSEKYPKWFYFLWLIHHLLNFRSIAAGKATTMGHIQRRHLSEAKIVVPPIALIVKCDALLSGMINRAISCSLETRCLSEIRDALLPKLISGEIRIKDVDKILEGIP